MHNSNPGNIASQVRQLIQFHQLRSDPYRLYSLALGTSRSSIAQFHKSVDQRFLLRQIKAIDSLLQGHAVTGAASIIDDADFAKEKVKMQNPVMLTLYGHRLAAGGSWVPA